MSEDLIKTVQKLIDSGKGDSHRLHEIFGVLKQGTPLYMSDYKYVQSLIKNLKEQEQIKSEKEIKSKKTKAQNKKTETSKKSEKIQSKGGSALKILKNRLASGEITIEEFQELKKVLKET
ncbi:MAG TPA: SHOCT domain-containing protein [Nitrosopumilaceae archaeon]|nr:SHOCT domain-containing protein [Nitrosopumilaceae archaeon]